MSLLGNLLRLSFMIKLKMLSDLHPQWENKTHPLTGGFYSLYPT
jgi:hypothetical protein